MSLTFGKTRVRNFGRIFEGNPRALTRNAYLNYLRHYKSQHPKYSLVQILRYGSKSWRKLRPAQQELFTQKNVLRSLARPRSSPLGRLSPSSGVRRSFGVPGQRIPMNYRRRSMNTARNVRRSWRNAKHLPKYRTK